MDLIRIGLWLTLGVVACVTLYAVFDRQRAEAESALRDKLDREAEDNRLVSDVEDALRARRMELNEPVVKKPEPAVTKAEYDRIQHGTSYRQVVRIIGAEGEESSSSYREEVPGVMKSVTTKIYVWKNGDGLGNMNAMFQNDKLITKAQFGLE